VTDAAPMIDEWSSTTDLPGLARWLAGARTVLCVTHVKPDGDAVGSTVAAARALNIAAGGTASGFGGVASRASVVYAAPIPHWLHAVAGGVDFRVIEPRQALPELPEPDAILVTDTGSWGQLTPFADFLRARKDKIGVIDHHLRGDADVSDRRVIDSGWASATMPVAELCRLVLGLDSCASLPAEVAEPLYLGMATDTGWFRHANVSPDALRLAADLLATGFEHTRLLQLTEQQERASRLKLLEIALRSLEYHDDGRVATIALRAKDYDKAGASRGESGGFLDIIKTVETVRVAALLTEGDADADGPLTKLSMRSKPGAGFVDVNVVASTFGGGGHAMAAGARIRAPLDEARRRVVEALS
jgi:phosphoesterase RecJ-like protein